MGTWFSRRGTYRYRQCRYQPTDPIFFGHAGVCRSCHTRAASHTNTRSSEDERHCPICSALFLSSDGMHVLTYHFRQGGVFNGQPGSSGPSHFTTQSSFSFSLFPGIGDLVLPDRVSVFLSGPFSPDLSASRSVSGKRDVWWSFSTSG